MSSLARSTLLAMFALAACSLTELDDLSSNTAPDGGSGGAGGSGGMAGSDLDASDAADVALTDTANDTPDGETAPCAEYCQTLIAACPGVGAETCVQSCQDKLAIWPHCSTEYAALVKCGAEQGTFDCALTMPLTNCTAQNTVFEDCTWYIDPLCSVPPVAPSGGSCYLKSGCNPVTNDCPPGELCYYFDSFNCYSVNGTESVCQACNDERGPYCDEGLSCVAAAGGFQCARYCCTDADCGGEPGSCMNLGTSGLKFCGQPK